MCVRARSFSLHSYLVIACTCFAVKFVCSKVCIWMITQLLLICFRKSLWLCLFHFVCSSIFCLFCPFLQNSHKQLSYSCCYVVLFSACDCCSTFFLLRFSILSFFLSSFMEMKFGFSSRSFMCSDRYWIVIRIKIDCGWREFFMLFFLSLSLSFSHSDVFI